MKCIFINETGGSDKLVFGEQPKPELSGDNKLLVKVTHSSINYIDTYHRSGLYKLPLPAILGRDGVGIVEAKSDNITDIAIGDRIAFCSPGSNAEYVLVNYHHAVKVHPDVSSEQAICCMLQGLTAQYLSRDSYRMKSGDTVLIHAGAGGTGGILIQIAKATGVKVITTVSTEEKAEIARSKGADVVINYSTHDNWAQKVREATGGVGVHAVYDGVGKNTWEGSMQCLKKRGTVVYFGNASGPVPPIDTALLAKYGSIFVTRPTLFDHIETREEFVERCNDIFELVAQGKVHLNVSHSLPLSETAKGHDIIESRGTTGKIVLEVSQ